VSDLQTYSTKLLAASVEAERAGDLHVKCELMTMAIQRGVSALDPAFFSKLNGAAKSRK